MDLNPYMAFRLTLTTVVGNPAFFIDAPKCTEAESIHILDEGGKALFVIVDNTGTILYRKGSDEPFYRIKDLISVIDGVGIFTSLEHNKPSHEAVVNMSSESIKLTVKSRNTY